MQDLRKTCGTVHARSGQFTEVAWVSSGCGIIGHAVLLLANARQSSMSDTLGQVTRYRNLSQRRSIGNVPLSVMPVMAVMVMAVMEVTAVMPVMPDPSASGSIAGAKGDPGIAWQRLADKDKMERAKCIVFVHHCANSGG